jgi:hypothetical protein
MASAIAIRNGPGQRTTGIGRIDVLPFFELNRDRQPIADA